MISKELFVKIIELIQKQDKIHDEVETALFKVTDGYVIFTGSELYYKALMELLTEVMDDHDNLIEWWLYEIVPEESWVEADGVNYNLRTAEDLYSFLIMELEKKNRNFVNKK